MIDIQSTMQIINLATSTINILTRTKEFLKYFKGHDEPISTFMVVKLNEISSKLDNIILRDLRGATRTLQDIMSLQTIDVQRLNSIENMFRKNIGLDHSGITGGISNSYIIALSYLGLINIELLNKCNNELIARYILHMFETGEEFVSECFPSIQKDLVSGDAIYAELVCEYNRVDFYLEHHDTYDRNSDIFWTLSKRTYVTDLISAERRKCFELKILSNFKKSPMISKANILVRTFLPDDSCSRTRDFIREYFENDFTIREILRDIKTDMKNRQIELARTALST